MNKWHLSDGGGSQYTPSYGAANLAGSTVAYLIQAGIRSTQTPFPCLNRNLTLEL